MFGCGDSVAPGALGFERDVAAAAFGARADRLRHWDGLDRDVVDWAYEMRQRAKAILLGGAGLLSLLGPLMMVGSGGGAPRSRERAGRVHVLPSTPETVRLGVFDSTLQNVLEINSGDEVVYPDTWSHLPTRLIPWSSISGSRPISPKHTAPS